MGKPLWYAPQGVPQWGQMKTLHRHVGLSPIRASDDVCEKAIIIILPFVALSGKSAEEMQATKP